MLKHEAMKRCPVDHGQLRASIDYDFNPDLNEVTLTAGAGYASFVEFGTGVYHLNEEGKPEPRPGWDVYPVHAKALRWEEGRKERLAAHKGKDQATIVFAQHVHIEGAEAHPFMRPAILQSTDKMRDIIIGELAR